MAAPGVTEETDSETYFRIIYRMPKQILLVVPNWADGVRDECVQRALRHDLIPVGEVLLGEPEDDLPDQGEVSIGIPEGVRLDTTNAGGIDVEEFLKGLSGAVPVSVDIVRVSAEVMLMAGLG